MVAKARLAKIVGAANVNDEPAKLEAYSGDMSFVNRLKPEFVVKVKTAADIEKLVQLLNGHMAIRVDQLPNLRVPGRFQYKSPAADIRKHQEVALMASHYKEIAQMSTLIIINVQLVW